MNQDVTDYFFTIGTSLTSMIIGAIIGSMMGYIVKDIFKEKLIFKIMDNLQFASAITYILILVANIILGVLAVIVFSKKKISNLFWP